MTLNAVCAQSLTGTIARTILGASIAAFGIACNAADADPARDYPNRPIRLIAQFQPGTTTDIIARLFGAKLSETWGQQVVVDNRPGAGGTVGTDLAAKAAPDGYTLAMGASGALGVAPGLFPKLPYDPVRDFAPIVNIVTQAQVLVASPAFPARTVTDVISMAKAKPSELNYASVGPGTVTHLTMEMLESAARIKLNHVPFKGSPPAYIAMFSGEIQVMFDGMPAAIPQIKAGKLRAIAVSTLQRQVFLPDVPAVAESGLPGFEAVGWTGLIAPARTPAPILDKLNHEVNRILNTEDAKQLLAANAFNIAGGTRQQYAAFIKSEIVKWTKIIKDAGIRVE